MVEKAFLLRFCALAMNEGLVLAQNDTERRRSSESLFFCCRLLGCSNQNCLCNKINFWGVKKITWNRGKWGDTVIVLVER